MEKVINRVLTTITLFLLFLIITGVLKVLQGFLLISAILGIFYLIKPERPDPKVWTEEELTALENNPDEPYGKIYLSRYSLNKQITEYEICSYKYEVSGNSEEFFNIFNRISADIVYELCKGYKTVTCVSFSEEPMDKLISCCEKSKYFFDKKNRLVKIDSGADKELLKTINDEREEWGTCLILEFHCSVLKDEFCDGSFFEKTDCIDFLWENDYIVHAFVPDTFHNAFRFRVDNSFIPERKVVEITEKLCEKHGKKLIKGENFELG